MSGSAGYEASAASEPIRKALSHSGDSSAPRRASGSDLGLRGRLLDDLDASPFDQEALHRVEVQSACAGRILSSVPVVTGFSFSGQSPKGVIDSEWLIVEWMYFFGQDRIVCLVSVPCGAIQCSL